MTQQATIPEKTFDKDRADAFAGRLLDTLNQGAIALMISLGHRTGLLDALASQSGSSAAIARHAELDERYVREWLGAMVTGRIVMFDLDTDTYSLPAEHAAFLTRAASPDNLAATAQFLPVLAQVEDRIVECFRSGGGVPYEEFPRFHEVMAEESDQTVVSALIPHILPLSPGLIDRLQRGIDVLDLGCGRGRALNLMARNFPNSRFQGYDLSEEATAAAGAEAAAHGSTNAKFSSRDVTDFGDRDRFDLITAFDAIHDQKDPSLVLAGIRNALRADGVFLMQDIRASSHVHQNIDNPLAPFFYTISTMHCMTVSLAQDGAGLGTCWGEELACEMLTEAGFGSVRVETLAHDIQNNFYIARP